MGMMALWKRMASDGLMSIAAVATVAVSLLLLATGPIYADAVSLAAIRATLRDAPGDETTIGVSIRASPDAYPALDELVTGALDGATAGVGATMRRSLASGSYRVPSAAPTSQLTDIVVLASVDDLADHAALVAGNWPTATGGTSASGGVTIDVAIDERVSVALGIVAGDRVDIEPTDQGRESLAAHVAAVYQVADQADRYWTGLDDLRAGGRVSSQFRTHPFVTTADALRSPGIGRLDADWLIEPDVDAVDLDQVDELRRGAAALEGRLISDAARAIDDPAATSEFEVTTELIGLLAGTERSVTVTRSSVFGVVFQIALLAGYALMLTAAIAVETRGRESRLLRSRGARPRDLGALAALEAACVAVPLALAAPFLAARALRLADEFGPLASIGLDLDPSPTSMSYLMAGIGAVVVVVVLVAPVVRGARRAERVSGTTRESASSRSQRAGVDLALLALAAVAFWQLATLGDDRAASVRGRFGVDPLLILAPAIGLFAAAVIALRLVPLSARAGEVTAVRSRRALPALVGWQVARRPSRYSRTALLLIAAIAVGVLATTFTTTWRASQEAQADQDVGADARVRPNRRTGDSIGDLHLTAAYESVDGVGRAMAMTRAPIELPGTEFAGELVSVGTDRAPTVIRSHDATTSTAIDVAMAELARHRPTIAGFELPGEPHAITATLEVRSNPSSRRPSS